MFHRHKRWEYILFHTHQKYGVKFQTLSRMNRHQCDAIHGFGIVVLVGEQGDVLDVRRERSFFNFQAEFGQFVFFGKIFDSIEQRFYIFQSAEAFGGVFILERFDNTAGICDVLGGFVGPCAFIFPNA